MNRKKQVSEGYSQKNQAERALTLCLHSFSDLTHVSPLVFIYLLRECYFHGTCKASAKFRSLQQCVHEALQNFHHPWRLTFAAECLFLFPKLNVYREGFSGMMLSIIIRFPEFAISCEDRCKAKGIATQLFIEVMVGSIECSEKTIVKLLEAFDIRLNIKEQTYRLLKDHEKSIEQYIFKLIKGKAYMDAVVLIERFSVLKLGEPFLMELLQKNQWRAAEKWSTFMGKSMVCVLVREYLKRNMLICAFLVMKKNNLKKKFPQEYYKCKDRLFKKLAIKKLQAVVKVKRNILDVDELMNYYLDCPNTKESKNDNVKRYLNLKEIIIEDIVWIDDANGLEGAMQHIKKCDVVGIDCEWKMNYAKGKKENQVSIMQIASDTKAFILDLIKLSKDVPNILDGFLAKIFRSRTILKLGYSFHCDMKELACSYGNLKCFRHYEKLLDVQKLFKDSRGGLSELAKKLLGKGLNKSIRNSDWGRRPLPQDQLEYAALDSAVLVQIFNRIRDFSVSTGRFEYKYYIVTIKCYINM